MDELTRILEEATAAVGEPYFRLPIDGGDTVYRERVYCYELYHQMRKRWPEDGKSPYLLNAEVDKRSHPKLAKMEIALAKPDLLVHGPGDMNLNYAVVEVKPPAADAAGIKKDLTTLSHFRRDIDYKRAIYLFFGDGIHDKLLEQVRTVASGIEAISPLEVWVHRAVGEAARIEFMLGEDNS